MVIVHVVNSVMHGGVGAMVRSLVLEQFKEKNKVVILTTQLEEVELKKWCSQFEIIIDFMFIEHYREKRLTLWGCLSKEQIRDLKNRYKKQKIIFHFHNTIACGLLSEIPDNSVCTIHGFIGKINKNKISNFIADLTIKRLIKNKVKMVGCCKSVADYCNKRYKTDRFLYVLNGLMHIEKSKENKYIECKKIKIGFSAYIDELKGWRILADAYASLDSEVKNKCCLYFAGEIDKKDKIDFYNFIAKENARYLGYIEDAGKNFIPFLDILILPSRTEGLPMSILEAMQQGVIPIATDVGGISEVIEDKISGFLMPRNSEFLCKLLEKLLVDENLISNIKQKAIIRYCDIATSKKMEENYLGVYKSIN